MRLFSAYIDPALNIDKMTRRSINRAAWRRWNARPLNGLLIGFAIAIPILLLPRLSSNSLLIPYLNSIPFYLLFIGALTYGLSITIVLKRFRYAPCIYAELRARGYDVCPKCGYWLRDLDQSITKCPECAHLRDAIPPAQPR